MKSCFFSSLVILNETKTRKKKTKNNQSNNEYNKSFDTTKEEPVKKVIGRRKMKLVLLYSLKFCVEINSTFLINLKQKLKIL